MLRPTWPGGIVVSRASPSGKKKSEGSGDPYIHVWWPWNAIIQQFVYIPELPELCIHAICNHNANFNLTRAQFR